MLSEPSAITLVVPRVSLATLSDPPLQVILQACYDLHTEGKAPSYENLMVRLEDPAIRALATDLIAMSALRMPEAAPLSVGVRPAPWGERLEPMLIVLAERERRARVKDLKRILDQTDPASDPDAYRAIELEYRRLYNQRLSPKNLKRPDPSSRASGRILDGQVG